MDKYDFSKHFNKYDTRYLNPKIMLEILEDVLVKSFDEIKREINNITITVTEEEIKKHLDEVFEVENPKLKEKIENLKVGELKLNDKICVSRYRFTSDSLKYYKNYSEIVREKAKKIFEIIEKIANKDCSTIVPLLEELDIKLDEDGNILKADIIRLILPFIYNYNSLVNKINEANNLNTYLNFKKNEYILVRRDVSEEELYPTSYIQIVEQNYWNRPDCIALSENQKRLIREKKEESFENAADIIFRAF